MKSRIICTILATALLAAMPAAHAQTPAKKADSVTTAEAKPAPGSASANVMASSTRIITTLQNRRSEFRSNPSTLRQFIDGELNRNFDRDYAARLVLGRHSRGATDAQIDLFASAMADNLMARYGTALLEIDGSPQFRYKSESPLPGNRGVKVSTELLRKGSEPTPVDYLMRQSDGHWKIFDVMIEGISYVQTFKNQFDAPLSQNSIEKVANELRSGKIKAGGNGR